jgi:hypothetical protein
MDIEGIALRFFRAAGYSLAAVAGLFLAGASNAAIISIAAIIAVLQLLNVLTYWASISAALLIVWGGLTAAGITPGAYSIMPLKNHIIEMANEARSKEEKSIASTSSVVADTGPAAKTDTLLATKLEDLKNACEKKILSPEECNTTRAKLLADFTK